MLDVTCLVIQDGESISQERFDSVPATTIELLKMEAGKYLEYVKGKYVVNWCKCNPKYSSGTFCEWILTDYRHSFIW